MSYYHLQRPLQQRKAAIQEELAFIEQLPPGLPIKQIFKGMNRWEIVLNPRPGAFQQALEIFPAVHIRAAADPGTGPDIYPSETEGLVFPIWMSGDTLCWYAKLPNSEIVRVTLDIAAESASMFQTPAGYTALRFPHHTLFRREWRKPPEAPSAALQAQLDTYSDMKERVDFATEKATEILNEFIAQRVPSSANKPQEDVLTYVIRKELGLPITVSYRETRAVGVDRSNVLHSYWLSYFDGKSNWLTSYDLRVPAIYDEKGFDWYFPTCFDPEALPTAQ